MKALSVSLFAVGGSFVLVTVTATIPVAVPPRPSLMV